jgi:hypothetical protein
MARQIRLLMFLAAGALAGCGTPAQLPPILSGLNGAQAPEGQVGSTVLAEGMQFATTIDSLVFLSSTGTLLPAPITRWTDNYIVGTVPNGAVGSGVYVENGGGPSQSYSFAVDPQDSLATSTFAWKAGPSLPVALSGQAVASAEIISGGNLVSAVYAVGGADGTGTPQTSVFYATVDNTGNLSAWHTGPALPVGLAFASAAAFTLRNSFVSQAGNLLVLGGATNAAGTPSNVIYEATLNGDGSFAGGWTNVSTLPVPLHSFGVFSYLGVLFVVGGATTNNVPVATVYRAFIQNDGTPILPWIPDAALPSARSHLGVTEFNGFAYVVGGDAGTATPNDSVGASAITDIDYAPIDAKSRRLLSGWTKAAAASLATPRSGLVALGAGAPFAGYVVVTGGVYSGASTGSSENNFVSAAGGIPSAVTTGTASIQALCSCNLFNQGATGYRDGSQHYHMLLVGGDDANTPGTKHTQTFTY